MPFSPLAAPRAASVWPSNRTAGGVDLSFARRYRLTKTDEFSSVFGFRRAIRGKWLMLHYQPRAETGLSARLGVVVGKKLLKRAVDRNLVKRIVREAFRLRRESLPNCDLVLRLHTRLKPLDGKLLREDVDHLLERLRKPRPRQDKP